jgi:hypothetical protein
MASTVFVLSREEGGTSMVAQFFSLNDLQILVDQVETRWKQELDIHFRVDVTDKIPLDDMRSLFHYLETMRMVYCQAKSTENTPQDNEVNAMFRERLGRIKWHMPTS